MLTFLYALLIIAGLVAFSSAVTMLLQGGTGFHGGSPKAPPPKKK